MASNVFRIMLNLINDRVLEGFIMTFFKDAKIFFDSIKESRLPPDQLYIHDDEQCPCGSGKIFLECCKNKPDPGPFSSPKPPEVLLMERMRKSLKKRKICLHPDQTSCQGNIKEAHALQNHKIISLLASSDNHVIMQDQTKQSIVSGDPLNSNIIVPFSKVSGNKATTQSCFCDLHDTELFKPIEAGSPDFDPQNEEMRFLYAYKAFIFEYAKQLQLMSILKETFSERPQVFSLPNLVKEYRIQCMRMEEFTPVKSHFDAEILLGTHNGIETCVVKIPYQIGFANYAYIAPDFDLNGERIKTIDNCRKMHRLAVTVFPESNQSYILLSCLSSEEKTYHDFFSQIQISGIEKVLFYFNLFLPLFSENLVISEKLWNNHSEKGQLGLVHMANLIGTDQFKMSQAIGMALRNAAKNKKMEYSKRGVIDLFQKL